MKLEKIIKRKWKRQTSLPVINVLLRKIKEGNKAFDATEYLQVDHEQFFQNLQEWKKNFEKSYLEQYPFLRQQIRHKEIYIKTSWVKRYR